MAHMKTKRDSRLVIRIAATVKTPKSPGHRSWPRPPVR